MTDRKTASTINDEELDRLYDDLDHAKRVARSAARDAATALTRQLIAEAAIERVRALHQPMGRGPFTVCTHCSGWDGARCLGVVTPHPCDTLTALEAPAQQPAAATGSGAAVPDSSTAAGP